MEFMGAAYIKTDQKYAENGLVPKVFLESKPTLNANNSLV